MGTETKDPAGTRHEDSYLSVWVLHNSRSPDSINQIGFRCIARLAVENAG